MIGASGDPGRNPDRQPGEEGSPARKPDPDEATSPGSLGKGLRILCAFDADHTSLSAREIAELTQINRGSVYRILRTLESLGYMTRSEIDAGRFSPTVRVLELGLAAVQNLPAFHTIRPRLDMLLDEFPDATAASYGELEGTQIVYVLRQVRREIIAINLDVGSRLPAPLSSIGKSVMAAMDPEALEPLLDRIELDVRTRFTPATLADLRASILMARKTGVAINDQELTVGLRSVAAPIRQGRQVLGAINIALPTTRATLDTLREHYGRRLSAVADEISTELTTRALAFES